MNRIDLEGGHMDRFDLIEVDRFDLIEVNTWTGLT